MSTFAQTQPRFADPYGSAEEQQSSASNRRGLVALLRDGITLCELQGKLLVHDLHHMKQGTARATLMFVVATVLAFATMPILMLGIGYGLNVWVGWPMWACLLTVAGVGGMVPAAALIVFGWKTLQKEIRVLERSRNELSRNAAWLKRELRSSA